MKNDSYTPEQMVAAIRTSNYSRGPLNAEQIQFITEEESSRHTASLIDLRSQLDVERNPERRAAIERDIAHNSSELEFWRGKVAPTSSAGVLPAALATTPPAPPVVNGDPPGSFTDQFMALSKAEKEGTAVPGEAFSFWQANREAIKQERMAACNGGTLTRTPNGKALICKPAKPPPQPTRGDLPMKTPNGKALIYKR